MNSETPAHEVSVQIRGTGSTLAAAGLDAIRAADGLRDALSVRPGGQIRQQAVFGAADGLVLLVGLVIGLHSHPAAMLAAAVSAGLAELAGMTSGAWLSGTGKLPALANGTAALAACVLPALPWAVARGTAALAASAVLAVAAGALIAWLRPEQGLRAIGQTFGVLAGAAVLCYLASLIGG